MSDGSEPAESFELLTTCHVRGACAGDGHSRDWVVEHFTPALLLQAGYRLRGPLRRHLEPEDLVNEVWAIALPRLPKLDPRDGRLTPVLVRFLGTTLLSRLRTLVRSRLRAERQQQAQPADTRDDPVRRVPDDVTGVVSRVADRELHAALHETLDSLGERDREVLVLRGIEQIENRRVAELLDLSQDAVTARYRRALSRLRAALPRSVFAELHENSEENP